MSETLQKLSKRFRSGITSLNYIDKDFRPLVAGLSYKPHHILANKFSEKTSRLFEAGFNKFWFKQIREKVETEEIGPEVLTLDHIGIGFVSCIVILTIAAAVFVLEIFYATFNQLHNNILNGIFAVFVIKAFLLHQK